MLEERIHNLIEELHSDDILNEEDYKSLFEYYLSEIENGYIEY
ncbi:hypothetical protein [Macrococcoides caseolyticum]|nr:hypothetical protein [Macrococcus caseolyticus]